MADGMADSLIARCAGVPCGAIYYSCYFKTFMFAFFPARLGCSWMLNPDEKKETDYETLLSKYLNVQLGTQVEAAPIDMFASDLRLCNRYCAH